MTRRLASRRLASVLVVGLLVAGSAAGCRKGLEIRRTGEWATPDLYAAFDEPETPVTLGVVQGPPGVLETAILRGIREGFPETTQGYGLAGEAVVVDLSLATHFEGDPVNFLIAWPGFIIFAPAWHGFRHTMRIELVATYHFPDRPPERGLIVCGYRSRSTTFLQGAETIGLGWASLATGLYGLFALLAAPYQIHYRDALTPFFLSRAHTESADIVEYLRWKVRREADRLLDANR